MIKEEHQYQDGGTNLYSLFSAHRVQICDTRITKKNVCDLSKQF